MVEQKEKLNEIINLIQRGKLLITSEPDETLFPKIEKIKNQLNPLLKEYFNDKNKKYGVNRRIFQIESINDFLKFRSI